MSNKNKTIILIVSLLVVIALIIVVSKPAKTEAPRNVPETAIEQSVRAREALLNASFIMPDTKEGKVLVNGTAEFMRAGTTIRVQLEDVDAVSVNGANGMRSDSLAVLAISYGDTAPVRYLGLYAQQPDGTMTMQSIALIAENAEVTSITTQDLVGDDKEEYLVEVSYSVASADGVVESKKYYVVENGYFNLSKTETVEQGKD